jgi:hypothetical protein
LIQARDGTLLISSSIPRVVGILSATGRSRSNSTA